MANRSRRYSARSIRDAFDELEASDGNSDDWGLCLVRLNGDVDRGNVSNRVLAERALENNDDEEDVAVAIGKYVAVAAW